MEMIKIVSLPILTRNLICKVQMLDFIVVVGTGVTFTLLEVPLMKNLVELPVVLIPPYGVGISGATHIFAFALLWKQRQTRRVLKQLPAEETWLPKHKTHSLTTGGTVVLSLRFIKRKDSFIVD